MGKQPQWPTLTIGGFVYLLTLFFAILYISDIFDLSFLGAAKDHEVLLSAVAGIFSYFLGLIAHRFIRVVLVPIYRCFQKPFRKKLKTDTEVIQGSDDSSDAELFVLKQYGSPSFQQHIGFLVSSAIDFTFTNFWIYRVGWGFWSLVA